MNIRCPTRGISCTSPDGSSVNDPDFPISNYTSEGPEQQPTWHSFEFSDSWDKMGCVSLCVSEVSQEEADICAANQEASCPTTHPNPPGGGGPITGDPPTGPGGGGGGGPLFWNHAESCDEKCTGAVHGFDVPAGFFAGPNQAVIDAYAKQIACDNTSCGNEAQQCTAYCPDGTPFTFTVFAGTFYAINQIIANRIAFDYACAKARQNMLCLDPIDGPPGTKLVSFGCLGNEYSGTITATSQNPGAGDITFTLDQGILPPGTSLNQISPSEAVIFGTPNASGDYIFAIRATAPSGASVVRGYTIRIKGIATLTPMPVASSGVPYSETLTTAGTIVGPLVWAVTAGSLPAGLTLNPSTGEISGTPTDVAETEYIFTMTMTDAQAQCDKEFSITVAAAGPDWDQLVWDQLITVDVPDGAGGFVSALGHEITVDASAGPGTGQFNCIFGGGGSGIGTGLVWAGGVVNCNVHMKTNSYTSIGLGGNFNTLSVFWDNGGGPVLLTGGTAPGVAGAEADYPFTIPGPGTITVGLNVGVSGPNPGDISAINYTTTITNLP